MTGERIALSPVQELHVRQHTADLLEVESVWQPGEPPPRHLHPRQQEEFEVLEGRLTVELGGAGPRLLTAGETVVVPPRTPHRMWNAGPETARASWRVTPALRSLEQFRFIAGGTGPPRALRMLWTFRHEFRLSR
ncbi:cupin domain-containing protein [Ornithinimicrobium cavernae]|uniref:cupin domain-containing protein n=1 Tax=Ornithinimicrobium cavernae TaxID=2666047 RepID=UPI000D685E2A|nr:cupin domain-containing protein [Ornithinimicrobium cavernae]